MNIWYKLVLVVMVSLVLGSVLIVKGYCFKQKHGPLRVLHFTFHTGCIKDFEEVAKERGLDSLPGTY